MYPGSVPVVKRVAGSTLLQRMVRSRKSRPGSATQSTISPEKKGILVIGSLPLKKNSPAGRNVIEARKNGAKVMVADVRTRTH